MAYVHMFVIFTQKLSEAYEGSLMEHNHHLSF